MTKMFTTAAGAAFIVLSILRLTPLVNAPGKWLLYVSIAAFFLILYDLVEFIDEGLLVRKGITKAVLYLRYFLIGSAVMAVIVLPNIKINISVKEVNALGDAFTLVSLGIAITLIGFKSGRAQSISLKKQAKAVNDEVREYLNSIEGQRIIKEHIRNQGKNI